MRKTRVLIVDDAVAIRRLLSQALASDPELEVAGSAANGRIGLAMIPQVNPDVLVLDLEMPEMGGLEALASIRATYPRLPVIVFSALTHRGAAATLDALALGANDYVTKPTSVDGPAAAASLIREQLAPRLKALGDRARGAGAAAGAPAPPPGRERAGRGSRRAEVVAIGISTGGPNALASLLARLPADCPAPVLIVQHMPPMFTRLLARRLDAGSALDVCEAVSGQVARPGQALLAPGEWHLAVERHGDEVRVVTHQEPPENSCRPAADVLFRSAARAFGAAALGVVMTGMGQDGLRGSREIHQAGGRLLAQDEESSVVWGMPGAVVRAGLADRVLPPDQLAAEIVRRVRGGVACGGLPA